MQADQYTGLYNGVYRAIVTSTSDPDNAGKIRTQCPQVSGLAELRWAEPSNPTDSIPVVGSIVWIFFNGGELTKPIYISNSVVNNTLVGQSNYFQKSTGQNSTTNVPANVTSLVFPVLANATYIFDGYLSYTGMTFASGPADLNLTWTIPSGSTFKWARNGYPSNSTNQIDTVETDNVTIRTLGTFGTSTNVTAFPKGWITTGSIAGVCQLQFAQNTTNATPTTINAGSWLRVTRIK